MTIVGAFLITLFFYSLVSRQLEKTILTGPMVFTIIGILTFSLIPQISEREIANEVILTFGEIALVLVLFSDASRISFKQVMHERDLPSRLLVIGLPLTIILGTVIAVPLFTDFSLWEAAIIATILAPTDASLGMAVVKSPLVPQPIREAISVESGLNDGLSTPFLMLFIALAIGEKTFGGSETWLIYFIKQIGFGILIGWLIGWGGGKLMTLTEKRNWVDENTRMLGTLALAVLSWGIASQAFAGNGFVAAFVAGGAFQSNYENIDKHKGMFQEFWGELLVYFVFFLFGIIATPALPLIQAQAWLYAVLSLTIVRMVPVAISIIGKKLQIYTVLFMGWFGPRGLASIVLGLIYLEQVEQSTTSSELSHIIIATVLLSIFAHGVTAIPGTRWYYKKLQSLSPDAPEFAVRNR